MRPASLLNDTYWVEYCKDIYGVDTLVDRSISEFYGRHYSGSNVVLTNGIEDPW